MENITVAITAALLGTLLSCLPVASGSERGRVRNYGTEEDIATIAELKLTPDQAERIRAIREGYIRDIRPFQDKMQDKREELKALWLQQNTDRKKIAAAQKEVEMLRDMLRDKLLEYREAISKVLNAEQHRKFKSVRQPQQMGPGFRWKKERRPVSKDQPLMPLENEPPAIGQFR